MLVLLVAVWGVSLAGSTGPGSFTKLLAFVPADAPRLQLAFTDWTRIRADEGLEHLTSAWPLEDKMALLASTRHDQAAPSAFGSAHVARQAEGWGWDVADHLWEGLITLEGLHPIQIVALAPWIDLEGIVARFRARGFVETTPVEGAVLFSHPLDWDADWIRTADLSILNTAVLSEERLLVMSSDPAGVHTLLSAWTEAVPPLTDLPWARTFAETLREANAVAALLGSDACAAFALDLIRGALHTMTRPDAHTELNAYLQDRPPVQPYLALALAYRHEDDVPVGQILFQYADPTLATADRAARIFLAEHGLSLRTGTPYRESIFVLRQAQALGPRLVLTIDPVEGEPRRLLHMLPTRDMIVAACPSNR